MSCVLPFTRFCYASDHDGRLKSPLKSLFCQTFKKRDKNEYKQIVDAFFKVFFYPPPPPKKNPRYDPA